MVELLQPYSATTKAGKGQGASTVLCPAAPFLRVPAPGHYPEKIILRGAPSRFLTQDNISDVEVHDELTDMCKEILGDWLNIEVKVAMTNSGPIPFVDPHDSGVTGMVVGPRIELLHKYFDAGPYLLSLLESCPLKILSAEEVRHYAGLYYFGWENEERHEIAASEYNTCLNRDVYSRPDELPPNLSLICDEVEEAQEGLDNRGGEWHDEFEQFPIGAIEWYGMIPYQDKRSRRHRDFCLPTEQGTSILWMALDVFADGTIEGSHWTTCIHPSHDIDLFETRIRAAKPYIRLMKYLTSSKETHEFSLHF